MIRHQDGFFRLESPMSLLRANVRVSCFFFRSFYVPNVFIRAIFNRVSRIIRNCFGFALLRYMIGLKRSCYLLNQSDTKQKPIATWSHAFSHAWRRLRVFASSSHWFIVLFASLVTIHCDCFSAFLPYEGDKTTMKRHSPSNSCVRLRKHDTN